MHFNELGINPSITNALTALGFTEPTEIQQKAIPLLLAGTKDLIGLAQTGTGKTAAFGIPLLHMLDLNNRTVQAIVLCPTRELCIQIERELKKYGAQLPGLSVLAVYGGADMGKQINALKRGVHVVVGTPGRVIDHLNRGTLKINAVRIAVLDEADEMLSMGFQDDIDTILQETPTDKKNWLFSATMPHEVERIINRYMKTPERVTVGSKNSSARNIAHKYCVVNRQNRYPALRRIIDMHPDFFGIVFCRTKHDTQEVAAALIRDGYLADALHGDLSQNQRDTVMRKLRNRTIRIIVATDVAARGIDVSDLTHVIHFSIPEKIENYTHRSGRTARAGKSGMSISLIGGRDLRTIKAIERIIGTQIEYMQIPDSTTVRALFIEQAIKGFVAKEVAASAATAQSSDSARTLLDTLSKEELINRIIDQHAHRIMSIHGDAQNLNETYNPDQANYGSDRRGGEYRGGGRSGGGYRGGDRGGRRFDRGGGYGRRSGGFRNDRGGHGGFRRDASAPSREISISR
jgi:ATP-dependent RNA helicase DeaD